MANVLYPSLYQINTRVYLTQLSQNLGRNATLDDISDRELDTFAEKGFDWIWFLGVWQTGLEGQEISRTNPEWRHEFEQTLPDLQESDIPGSCFAITGYTVHHQLGGDEALSRLRQRLQQRGLKLLLDFVPNHTAPDHLWVAEHPDYYVAGTEADLAREPQNYRRVTTNSGDRILAYGRDPYFAGWPDTLQLNYANPALQSARIEELIKIAHQCDGVRCDMAMLLVPNVFERTWGIRPEAFWQNAIATVHQFFPQFTFIAEVYWDMEWELQQQGFDYCYDKRLYDRLREKSAKPVREHFWAGLDYQTKLARFLENHDEPRAAATFADDVHQAAAVITFFAPGLRFFHQGQLQGFRQRISPHLGRGPNEPTHLALAAFYDRLLKALRQPTLREGQWRLGETVPAWEGNWTWENFIVFYWQGNDNQRFLVVVNYSPFQSQSYIKLNFAELAGRVFQLKDVLSEVVYERNGDDLREGGVYFDVSPWGYHLFDFLEG